MPTVVISPFILLLPLAALAWYSRRWALLVLLASLSAYIIRGSVFGLPTTWLELGIYLTLVVWLVKGDWRVWQEIKLSALQGWLVPLALWLPPPGGGGFGGGGGGLWFCAGGGGVFRPFFFFFFFG